MIRTDGKERRNARIALRSSGPGKKEKMKIAALWIVGTLFAGTVLARVGETPEEAAERYGPPRDSFHGIYSNTIIRVYNKDGILVEAAYFMNGSGKSVIGEIKYLLPYEIGKSNVVAKTVFTQLLEANAAGQQWELQNNRPATQDYRRDGATATMTPALLTVTLDEYAVLVAAEKARIATQQGERIDRHLKDF